MKKGLHKKPTNEELDENINAALKELDEPETPEIPVVPETPDPEIPKVPETPETPKTPDEVKKEEKDNYEKRYRDSTAEAQVLYSKNKKITEAIKKAGSVSEPTDGELAVEYPEWEEMSDFEKRLAKDSLMNKRGFEAIKEATKEFEQLDKWSGEIDSFLTDPATLAKHTDLDGRENEFKMFASKPTRQGVDFEDLVSAFLYSESVKPAPTKNKQMFETGTGGINEKPKPPSNKISVDESQRLRITDYKKYLEYLKQGRIEELEA